MNNKTIFFPALSVGSALSVIEKNTPHFLNGGSFRFGNKDSLFYYPYMLISSAHGFKKPTFRKDIGFTDEGLLWGDSGGYQIWAGTADKKFNKEVALEWLNANCDIFPIVDIPPSKDKKGMSLEHLTKCAEQSLKNAIYFRDNALKGKHVLNVLQGRNYYENDIWYEIISKANLNNWAFAGRNFIQIATAFFYLLDKGELQRSKYFHIFGVTRPKYIVFIEYLQKLLNEKEIDCTITFDSSYPFRTCAFGSYFLFPTTEGIRNMSFSNRFDYSHLTQENTLPCDCPFCKDVPIKEFTQFTTNRFYAITSFHNLYILVQYKNFIDKLMNMCCDDLLNEAFMGKDNQVFRVLKNLMNDTSSNKASKAEKMLEPLFKYEIESEENNLSSFF